MLIHQEFKSWIFKEGNYKYLEFKEDPKILEKASNVAKDFMSKFRVEFEDLTNEEMD
jgi:hypothetical protein